MDTIALLFIVIVGMSLSLLAAHLWVGVIDTVIHGIKRCFPIEKRKDMAYAENARCAKGCESENKAKGIACAIMQWRLYRHRRYAHRESQSAF